MPDITPSNVQVSLAAAARRTPSATWTFTSAMASHVPARPSGCGKTTTLRMIAG